MADKPTATEGLCQECPNGKSKEQEEKDKKCAELKKKMDELINRNKHSPESIAERGGPGADPGTHGLRYRFAEQITGLFGPGTPEWLDHENKIKEMQQSLTKRIKEYNDNGCNNGMPPGAEAWTAKPVPKPEEWRGRGTAPFERSMLQKAGDAWDGLSTGEKVGVGVVGGVVVIGAAVVALPAEAVAAGVAGLLSIGRMAVMGLRMLAPAAGSAAATGEALAY